MSFLVVPSAGKRNLFVLPLFLGEKDGSIEEGEFFFTSCSLPLAEANLSSDQLWTNDKLYKPAEAVAEFPDDLADYPDPGSGWMNEMGVRIDMDHHLIPPRSALKHHPSRRATA
jgi:hypothetical protein